MPLQRHESFGGNSVVRSMQFVQNMQDDSGCRFIAEEIVVLAQGSRTTVFEKGHVADTVDETHRAKTLSPPEKVQAGQFALSSRLQALDDIRRTEALDPEHQAGGRIGNELGGVDRPSFEKSSE